MLTYFTNLNREENMVLKIHYYITFRFLFFIYIHTYSIQLMLLHIIIRNTLPDVRFGSMPNIYLKARVCLIECNNTKIEKRIKEQYLGKVSILQ